MRTLHFLFLSFLILQACSPLPQERGCHTDSDCQSTPQTPFCYQKTCSKQQCQIGSTSNCYNGNKEQVGTGSCAQGKRHCLSSGLWSSCFSQTLPITEVCDRLDNDCNGELDDGIRCDCAPGEQQKCYNGPANTINQGICAYGIQHCEVDRKWGRCLKQIKPKFEICDGKDNDCNGKVDDQISCQCKKGMTRDCYTGKAQELEANASCKAGKQVCGTNNQWDKCFGEIKAKPEVCDGKDNNCNGQIDENMNCQCEKGTTRDCYTGKAQELKANALCKAGKQVCGSNSQWDKCFGEVKAKPEICDKQDNNCNGKVDEGLKCGCKAGAIQVCYSGSPKELKVNALCKVGRQTCAQNQKWEKCVGEIKPQLEICDGKDNNCDGRTDENCGCGRFGREIPCYTGSTATQGIGACKQGKKTCKKDRTWSKCLGQKHPEQEVCNGKDDDCNGRVDESIKEAACTLTNKKGPCRQGKLKCISGQSKCMQVFKKKEKEICGNSLDDDCDGIKDNPKLCQRECKPFSSRICYPYRIGCAIPPEVNPKIDCTGTCYVGIKHCLANGTWGKCSGATGPKSESCNNKDDDCDGKVDNNISSVGKSCSTSQYGICSSGTEQCAKGMVNCKPKQTPQPENCKNGKDNNCDGKIDQCCSLVTHQPSLSLGTRQVFEVAISKNEKMMILAKNHKEVELWDLKNKRRTKLLSGHKDSIQSIQFSPNNKTFASASKKGEIILWDTKTLSRKHLLSKHKDLVYRLKYSKNGMRLASASKDKTAIIWDTKTGAAIKTLTDSHKVFDLSFLEKNNQLITVGKNQKVLFWDLQKGSLLKTIRTPHQKEITSVDVHPNEQVFATGSWDKQVIIWSTSSKKTITVLQAKNKITQLRYSPDGKWLAASSYKGSVSIWQVNGNAYTIYKNTNQTNKNLYTLTWSKDSKRLFYAGEDEKLYKQGCP